MWSTKSDSNYGTYRSRCKCNPYNFCYVCGNLVFREQKHAAHEFLKVLYFAYFHVKRGNYAKQWTERVACKTHGAGSRYWHKGKRVYMAFGLLANWHDAKNLQMIAICYAMCLGTVEGKKAVIKPAVSYKACATMYETFRFLRHWFTGKIWVLLVANFLYPPIKLFSHETKKTFLLSSLFKTCWII